MFGGVHLQIEAAHGLGWWGLGVLTELSSFRRTSSHSLLPVKLLTQTCFRKSQLQYYRSVPVLSP